MTKLIKTKIGIIIGIVFGFFLLCSCLHKNDVQNFQVVQSLTGNIEIISQGGYYIKFFPKTWTYPKVETVYFSNEKDESKDNDGVKVRFSNKGEGDITKQDSCKFNNFNTSNIYLFNNAFIKIRDECYTKYFIIYYALCICIFYMFFWYCG